MDVRLAALLDKQEIEEVLSRYCRGIDRRDFPLVRSCYHPDATDDHGSFSGGVEDFVAWVDRLTARYRFTMHLVAQISIEFGADDGPGRSVAAAETTGVSIHRSDDPRPYLNLATGFRYLDRFERRDGTWKIASRVAIGEWSLQLPEEAWWEIPDDHLSGRRDGSDALYQLLAAVRATAT